MLPRIEPDDFKLADFGAALGDELFEYVAGFGELGFARSVESLLAFFAIRPFFMLTVEGRRLEIITQISAQLVQEAGLARAPRTAYADHIRRIAFEYAMAYAPRQLVVSEGVVSYGFVVECEHRRVSRKKLRQKRRHHTHRASVGEAMRRSVRPI